MFFFPLSLSIIKDAYLPTMAEDNIKEVFNALTVDGSEDIEGKLYGKILYSI